MLTPNVLRNSQLCSEGTKVLQKQSTPHTQENAAEGTWKVKLWPMLEIRRSQTQQFLLMKALVQGEAMGTGGQAFNSCLIQLHRLAW